MNVLLTGGAGLIGMAARRCSGARGHMVVATDITDFGRDDAGLETRDLRRSTRLEGLIDRA